MFHIWEYPPWQCMSVTGETGDSFEHDLLGTVEVNGLAMEYESVDVEPHIEDESETRISF